MRRPFKEALPIGQECETLVGGLFARKGFSVLQIYKKESSERKGPRIYTATAEYCSADLQVMKDAQFMFVEVKYKTALSWHRISRAWTTGIDTYLWNDYVKLAQMHPIPFWIMFLYRESTTAKGALVPSVTGLYGATVSRLKRCISHTSTFDGGMTYWNNKNLTRIASLEEVYGP